LWVSRRYLILSAVVGIAVALVCYLYLAPSGVEVPVVLAADDIPSHVRIHKDMVRVEQVPASAVHPLSMGEVTSVVGKYARREILSGEQVLSATLVDAGGQAGGLAWQVDADYRAMSVPAAPSSAVGGAVRPGNLVDVVHYRESSVHGPAVGRILMSAVQVLQLRDGLGGIWDPESREAPSTAVLAVTPREAESLAYAMATGEIFLTVSPHNPEAGDVSGSGVGGSNLFGDIPDSQEGDFGE